MDKKTEKEYVEALKQAERELTEQRKKITRLRQKLIDIRNVLDRD